MAVSRNGKSFQLISTQSFIISLGDQLQNFSLILFWHHISDPIQITMQCKVIHISGYRKINEYYCYS